MTLDAFQQAFARALDPLSAAEVPDWLASQPGFAVYRNTVIKGAVDALLANYPATAALVGVDWLRAAATCHARATPPEDPVLLAYGAAFPDFLATFPPAAGLPWLADVARLDRAWTECHLAADAPVADAAACAALAPAVLAARHLLPHPAARWAWFEPHPGVSLWQRSRAVPPLPLDDVPWVPEGVLLSRPDDAVQVTPLTRGGCAFLSACAAGATVSGAVDATLAVEPAVDFAALFAGLLQAGAFAAYGAAP